MDNEWKSFINSEMEKDYMKSLKEFVATRRKEVNVLPEPKLVFNCFTNCPWNDLKVVIIGQEPYTSIEDSDGIAFSSKSNKRPYALKNILDEVFNDYYNGNTGKYNPFETNSLVQWSKQGVLLYNSTLTTEANNPCSHDKKGWQYFSENLIKHINQNNPGKLVFMLWGNHAKEYKKLINEQRHLILEADHPTSVKFNPKNWFGNKHFTKANNWIHKHYHNQKTQINWGLFKNRM